LGVLKSNRSSLQPVGWNVFAETRDSKTAARQRLHGFHYPIGDHRFFTLFACHSFARCRFDIILGWAATTTTPIPTARRIRQESSRISLPGFPTRRLKSRNERNHGSQARPVDDDTYAGLRTQPTLNPPDQNIMSRISKERMKKALEQREAISDEDYAKVKAIATSSGRCVAFSSRPPMITG
jgi:hypothetical protein